MLIFTFGLPHVLIVHVRPQVLASVGKLLLHA